MGKFQGVAQLAYDYGLLLEVNDSKLRYDTGKTEMYPAIPKNVGISSLHGIQ